MSFIGPIVSFGQSGNRSFLETEKLNFPRCLLFSQILQRTVDFSETDDSKTCVEEWELTRCVEDIQKVSWTKISRWDISLGLPDCSNCATSTLWSSWSLVFAAAGVAGWKQSLTFPPQSAAGRSPGCLRTLLFHQEERLPPAVKPSLLVLRLHRLSDCRGSWSECRR